MVNWGLLPLIYQTEQDYAAIEQGDELLIDKRDKREDVKVRELKEKNGNNYYDDTTIEQEDLAAIKLGGRKNKVK